MQLVAPVTDYIPASILTTLGDMPIRGAAIPERIGMRSGVLVRLSGDQVVPTGASTLIEFDTEVFDVGGEFDPSAGDHMFEPNADGTYLLGLLARYADLPDTVFYQHDIRNGATRLAECGLHAGGVGGSGHLLASIAELVTTDIVKFYTYHLRGVNATLQGGNIRFTQAFMFRLTL